MPLRLGFSLSGVLLVLGGAGRVRVGNLLLLRVSLGTPVGLDRDERSARAVTRVIGRVSIDS